MKNPFTQTWHSQMRGSLEPIETMQTALKINGESTSEVFLTPFVLTDGATLSDLRLSISRLDDGFDHLLLEVIDPTTVIEQVHGVTTSRSFYLLVSAVDLCIPQAPSPLESGAYLLLELGANRFVASTVSPRRGGMHERIHPHGIRMIGSVLDLGGTAAELEPLAWRRSQVGVNSEEPDLAPINNLAESIAGGPIPSAPMV